MAAKPRIIFENGLSGRLSLWQTGGICFRVVCESCRERVRRFLPTRLLTHLLTRIKGWKTDSCFESVRSDRRFAKTFVWIEGFHAGVWLCTWQTGGIISEARGAKPVLQVTFFVKCTLLSTYFMLFIHFYTAVKDLAFWKILLYLQLQFLEIEEIDW